MKIIHVIISIMMALVLCITPVAAVSADDFEIVVDDKSDDDIVTYKYRNLNNMSEEYTEIYTHGTCIMDTLVTFRPANIPGAPVMEVDTDDERFIYLPRSVDVWEIKYYSTFWDEPRPDNMYIKNYGVVNLNKKFGDYIEKGLYLALMQDQVITCMYPPFPSPKYYIPDVSDWWKEDFDWCSSEV